MHDSFVPPKSSDHILKFPKALLVQQGSTSLVLQPPEVASTSVVFGFRAETPNNLLATARPAVTPEVEVSVKIVDRAVVKVPQIKEKVRFVRKGKPCVAGWCESPIEVASSAIGGVGE